LSHSLRATAFYVKIKDLIEKKTVQGSDEPTLRVRLVGEVVKKYVSNDSSYAFIVVDDETETIRIKTFENTSLLKNITEGSLVLVIGRVRESTQGEVYVLPEIIKTLTPNLYYYHKIQSLLLNKSLQKRVKSEDRETREAVSNVEKIIRVLQKGKTSFKDLCEQAGVNEKECQEILKILLESGEVYEPRKRVYALI